MQSPNIKFQIHLPVNVLGLGKSVNREHTGLVSFDRCMYSFVKKALAYRRPTTVTFARGSGLLFK